VDDGELFECECGLFKHTRIVCCHAIKVSVIFHVFNHDNFLSAYPLKLW
jgi:hypothetical protein